LFSKLDLHHGIPCHHQQLLRRTQRHHKPIEPIGGLQQLRFNIDIHSHALSSALLSALPVLSTGSPHTHYRAYALSIQKDVMVIFRDQVRGVTPRDGAHAAWHGKREWRNA